MILTDRDNTMDYYDCGFTNVMSSNLASVRTTNDFTNITDIISPNTTSIDLSEKYQNEIALLHYRIDELENTVEKLIKILATLNIINI